MIITKKGGGLQAVFSIVQRNFETGRLESVTERIFGDDELELWERIRQRFPRYRQNYKQPWRQR